MKKGILIYCLIAGIIFTIQSCYSVKKSNSDNETKIYGCRFSGPSESFGFDTLFKSSTADSIAIFKGLYFNFYRKNNFCVLDFPRGLDKSVHWYSWGNLIDGKLKLDSHFLTEKDEITSFVNILEIIESYDVYPMNDSCFNLEINSEFIKVDYAMENIIHLKYPPENSDEFLRGSFEKNYVNSLNLEIDTLHQLVSSGYVSSLNLANGDRSFFSVSNGWYTIFYVGEMPNNLVSVGEYINKSDFDFGQLKLTSVICEFKFLR